MIFLRNVCIYVACNHYTHSHWYGPVKSPTMHLLITRWLVLNYSSQYSTTLSKLMWKLAFTLVIFFYHFLIGTVGGGWYLRAISAIDFNKKCDGKYVSPDFPCLSHKLPTILSRDLLTILSAAHF